MQILDKLVSLTSKFFNLEKELEKAKKEVESELKSILGADIVDVYVNKELISINVRYRGSALDSEKVTQVFETLKHAGCHKVFVTVPPSELSVLIKGVYMLGEGEK